LQTKRLLICTNLELSCRKHHDLGRWNLKAIYTLLATATYRPSGWPSGRCFRDCETRRGAYCMCWTEQCRGDCNGVRSASATLCEDRNEQHGKKRQASRRCRSARPERVCDTTPAECCIHATAASLMTARLIMHGSWLRHARAGPTDDGLRFTHAGRRFPVSPPTCTAICTMRRALTAAQRVELFDGGV
jgi:hypothetical protein